MKYYLMCKKVLGQKQFDELIISLTNQVVDKFSSDIFLDKFMEILEYNIRLIMIISIANVLNLDEEEKVKRISLQEVKDFLIVETIKEFEEKNKSVIRKITDLLK